MCCDPSEAAEGWAAWSGGRNRARVRGKVGPRVRVKVGARVKVKG